MRREPALKAADVKAHDFVPGLGHAGHFHAAIGPYEKNFGIGQTAAQLIGNGDGRENMPARAAAGDDETKGEVGHG